MCLYTYLPTYTETVNNLEITLPEAGFDVLRLFPSTLFKINGPLAVPLSKTFLSKNMKETWKRKLFR